MALGPGGLKDLLQDRAKVPTALLGRRRLLIEVNALHKQAVKKTGEGVFISASEDNGIVQAIEVENYPCLIGVQWHPEYLITHKTQRKLFRSLVQLANEYCDRNT